jgi:hypothetical protein
MKKLRTKLSLLALVGLSTATQCIYAGSAPIICPGNTAPIVKASANFIYCGPAVCKPNSDGVTATCDGCYQMKGENLATLSCEARAPQADAWYSSFSAKKVLLPGEAKQPLVICDTNKPNVDATYADCLDSKCSVPDPKTGLSQCQCKLETVTKGVSYITQTHSCATENKCMAQKGEVLNGAPTALVAPLLAMIDKKTNEANLLCSQS